MFSRNTILAATLTTALCTLIVWHVAESRARLYVQNPLHTVPADGRDHEIASIFIPPFHSLRTENLPISEPNAHLRQEWNSFTLFVHSPVAPGQQTLHIHWRKQTIPFPLTFTPDVRPSLESPGLPDWMPLHSAEDRSAFRRWFTALADAASDVPSSQLPPEIDDCAALLRYSYREALRRHNDRWLVDPTVPPFARLNLPSVQQWSFPNSPAGSGLFRTRPGRFIASDLTDGTFAQFADAKTLVAANTFFVSRNLRDARPGDLIFYRLLELDSHHNSQYHSMIVTGENASWVVYHTGPISAPDGKQAKGEIRRVLLRDLLHHPDPRWRPEPANPNFLGVYRWSILDGDF